MKKYCYDFMKIILKSAKISLVLKIRNGKKNSMNKFI